MSKILKVARMAASGYFEFEILTIDHPMLSPYTQEILEAENGLGFEKT